LVGVGLADGTVKVFDMTEADPAKSVPQTYAGHTGPVSALALVPDGGNLLSGSADKTVKTWLFATPGVAKTLNGHTGQIFGVAWFPDGERVATGAADKTARIWDVATAKEARSIAAHAEVVYA